jgi:hypothetical protein
MTTSGASVLVWRWLFAAVAAVALTACGASSAPKTPDKQGVADGASGTDTGTGTDVAADPSASAGATALDVEADSSTSLSGTVGTAMSLTFNVVGDGGKNIGVGLIEAPSGMIASASGTTITVAWSAPIAGAHEIKFLLRDMDRCTAAKSEADCKVDGVSPTALKVGEFDVTSKAFNITVDGSASTDPSTSTDTGTGNGGLIDAITSLLGGGGGGGGLQDLLSGLSNGQLQDLLGQLTGGGGGGFDISQILGALGGGTNLTDGQAPQTP